MTGAFNAVGGTFAHNNGHVLLASSTNQTLTNTTAAGVARAFYDLTVNDRSLVGYWRLDETATGTAADSSGFGQTGAAAGAGGSNNLPQPHSASLPSTAFANPRCLDFDGVDDVVAVPDSANLRVGGAITLSAWINLDALGSDRPIIQKRSASSWDNGFNYGMWVRASGNLFFQYHDGQYRDFDDAGGPVATGAWTHVAVVADETADTVRFYRDGLLTRTFTDNIGTMPTGGAEPVRIGGFATSYWADGKIDDVRVYARALTATEISALAAGNQPSVASATQTLGGGLDVDRDLVLASGGLDVSASVHGVAVGGSWQNRGGVFTPRTGTVTFDGATGGAIQAGRNRFANVSVTGAGTWSLGDRLDVDAILTLSAGVLDVSSSSYVVRAGTVDQTSAAGGFVPRSGTVVVDSSTARDLKVATSLNHLRVEARADNGLVGGWKLDDGTGTTARDSSGGTNHGSLLGSPRWTTSVPGAITRDDPGSLRFDGVDDRVSAARPMTSTDNWTLSAWINPSVLPQADAMVVYVGDNPGGYGFSVDGNDGAPSSRLYGLFGAVVWIDSGYDFPAAGAWYHVVMRRSAGTTTFWVNGAQTPNSSAGSAPNAPNAFFEIGHQPGEGGRWYTGAIDDVRVYDRAVGDTEIIALAAGRFANGATGTPTFTLTGNLAVGGTLTLDSGVLDCSTRTTALTNLFTLSAGDGKWLGGTATQAFSAGLTMAGSTFVGSTGTVDVTGAFTMSGGAFTAPSGQMQVSGAFARTGGTFTANGGEVLLDGGSQAITGSTTFANLSKSTAAAVTLTFPAGGTQTVTGVLTLEGDPSQLLTLASSSPGTRWLIDPQGTWSVDRVSVSWSKNLDATVIEPTNSVNGGKTINWFAVGEGTAWSNGNATGIWSDALNWDNGKPTAGKIALFDATSTDNCAVDEDAVALAVDIQAPYTHATDATITQGAGNSMTVGTSGWTQVAGTFTGDTTGTTSEMMTTSGAFALSGTGAFTSTRSSLVVGGNFTVSASSDFVHNSGTVLLKSASNRTLTCTDAFANLILNDCLTGYWSFDDASSPALDASGNGHHATWQGSPVRDTAVKPALHTQNASSIDLDGTGQYLSLSDPAAFQTSEITIASWVYVPVGPTWSDAADYRPIFNVTNNSTGFSLIGSVVDEVWMMRGTANGEAPALPSRGVWHHVAGTFVGVNQYCYVDGVKGSLANWGGALTHPSAATANAWIGRNSRSGGYYLNAQLDDLRIYSAALSDAVIARMATGRNPANATSTVTLASTLDVDGDLTIASGGFATANYAINVGGSWTNSGGTVTPGTTTVTFDGTTSTDTILSGDQSFATVVIAGSGSDWTCLDAFQASALTQTASTFRGGTHRMRITGDLTLNGGTHVATSDVLTCGGAVSDAGGGIFTANGGTVKLAATVAKTVTMADAFNDLVVQGGGDDGLVAHLRFDEGTVFHDHSGNGRTGTYSGSPTLTSTKPTLQTPNAYALNLTGGTGVEIDYVTLAGTDTIHLASYTLSAWYYPVAAGSVNHAILTKDGWNSGLIYAPGGNFANELWLENGGGNPGGGPYGGVWSGGGNATGTWHHVAGVVDLAAGTNTIYVNGVAAGTTSTGGVAGHSFYNGQPWRIGQAPGYLATGNVDDVRIYSRALAADEILALSRGFDGGSTSTVVHTLGTNLDVDSDLTLLSGGLALSTFDAAVADNWLNYGASFSGAARTVSFDGTAGGPHTIRSDEQSFGTVAVTGSRTWQLGDRFTATGPLTISNGSFDVTSANHTVRVATMDQTAPGAFVARQGTVVLDSATDRNLRVATSSLWRLGLSDVATDSSLVAHYAFDQASGTTEPDLGGGATSENATLTASRSSDVPADVLANRTSLRCPGDGTGARIADPGAYELDFTAGDSITIAAWVKPVTNADWSAIAIKGNRHPGLYVGNGGTNDGRLSFYYLGAGDQPGFQTPLYTIQYGVWQHVAVVCTPGVASSAKFYLDGIAVAGCTWMAGTGNEAMLGDNGAEWRIGTYDLTSNQCFDGWIDDVRIYRRILTAAEIASVAGGGPGDGGTAANATSLAAYLALEDGAGPTTKDRASAYAAKTGTLVNATWSGDVPTTRFANAASLAFDGSGDRMTMPDPGTASELDFDTGDQITIAAWVKATGLGGNRTIVIKGREGGGGDTNFALRTTAGFLEFYYYSASGWHEYLATTNALTTGAWTHVAATYTYGVGASARLYVGGAPVTTASWTPGNGNAAPTVIDHPLVLGSIDGGEYWDGLIDDVRVYRGTLSAAEIAALAGGAWDGQGAGTATWTMLAPLDVDEDLCFDGGRLGAGSHAITVGGDWRNRAGPDALLPGTGLVTLNGTSQRLFGSTVFNGFTKSTAGVTLTFPASEPQWFLGTMTLAGSSGSLLTLASSNSGTQGIVVPYGLRPCTSLRVQDSWNQVLPVIAPTFSSSGLNHTNWFGQRTRAGPVGVGYPPLH
ncbi:MAG: LamG domain-containing protein [Planctomycetes bacterium]|nr:LamG domain-containing protein [Planctomycetota bacterium]